MNVAFDFSELNKFLEEVKDSHERDTTLMTATQKIARVLHQHLLEQTPVKTGNLRKMWSAGDNLRFTVERVNDGFQVTFINSASANTADGYKYGLAVNDGHKSPNGGWVVGRFFVENSIDLTVPKVEEIVMKELQKWWDSV